MSKKICLLVCFFAVSLFANEKQVIVFDYGGVVGNFDQKLQLSFVYPDMQEIIHKLKAAGYRLALLSNMSENSASTIRNKGFYDAFNPVILSCDIGVKKPDPQAYLHLLTALQVPAENCIFIDDKAKNVDAAKALHMDGIIYVSVEELVKELQKRGIQIE